MKSRFTNIERRRLIILSFVLAAIVAVSTVNRRCKPAVDINDAIKIRTVSVDSVKSTTDSCKPPVSDKRHRKKKGTSANTVSTTSEPTERDRLDEPVRKR